MTAGWSWTPVLQIAAGFILGALAVSLIAGR